MVICPSPLLATICPNFAIGAEIRSFRGGVFVSEENELHVRNASQKRRDEFAAGRSCAAAALKSLGASSLEVGREPGGAPIWPYGATGSISHTDQIAAALVASAKEVRTIGLDVEQIGAVKSDLWPSLFSGAERTKLAQTSDLFAQSVLATMLFAAKEAFYKAQWPITRQWIDFLEVEVEVRGGNFVVHCQKHTAWEQGTRGPVLGAFAISDDVVAAVILVRSNHADGQPYLNPLQIWPG
ncbi:4'-phosphopantetheinyl transferase family protein [Sphingomonas gei]|nr:4'-phosphopantetheinyl transferase superfamily protein [Sphingomonas gei]